MAARYLERRYNAGKRIRSNSIYFRDRTFCISGKEWEKSNQNRESFPEKKNET